MTFSTTTGRAIKKKPGVELAIVVIVLASFAPDLRGADTGLPQPGNNKVAYYVFDSGGPDHYPMPTFTDAANIVVGFEGTGKSRDITAPMNFIMDMAYFVWDYAARFRQWADSIGASKTMVGVLNDYYDVSHAMSAAAWQPASPPKAASWYTQRTI